jgi:hypothetical protein
MAVEDRQGTLHRGWRWALAVYAACLLLAAALALISLNSLLRSNRSPANPPAGAPAGPSLVKLYTRQSGFHAVPLSDLQAAGFKGDLSGGSPLRLRHKKAEVPFWIEGDTLRFYAQASQDLYSAESVYWLAGGGAALPGDCGCSLPPVSDEPAPARLSSLSEDAAQARLRREENLAYFPQVEDGDHWMWAALPAPQSKAFDFSLSALAPGEGQLVLSVWSGSESPATPDHRLRLAVNGQPVQEASWDGKGRHVITATLASGLLADGVNQLRVEAPGLSGVAADVSYVDWFQVVYPRWLAAEHDRLAFTASGGVQVFTGFSGPVSIYDMTDPGQPVEAARGLDPRRGFQGQAGHPYEAVGPQGWLQVEQVTAPVLAPDLRLAGRGADYVAIGPADLLAPLEPLLALRNSQGLQTASLPAEAVYDQFGEGLPDPKAIQAFMQYAVSNWKPAPRDLLLVGDASYDPRGYLAPPEANRLPTFLVMTVYGGETASDIPFVQVNSDPWPDLAVGRIPAGTPEQVRILVEKTLQYEKGAGQGGAGTILAVADGQDPAFRADAQAFLDLFPPRYPRQLYAPAAEVSGAAQLASAFSQGQWLVAYFGHGSINMWGKDRLFTAEDAAGQAGEPRLPVILQMTCLTGLFTHPKAESLSEALLWNPRGGAVATLAPTSLTLPFDQALLSKPLAEALLADPQATLGQALLAARRSVPLEQRGALDVMQTFLLLGDPALRIAP